MPIDSHSYLVKQGWEGKGTALRHGALARPIAIPQKRTLAGVGKDRDEAFPFWDHLFTVAAKTIKVKVHDDSGDESIETNDASQANTAMFARTRTGILSNKRPLVGTPASNSGTSTPSSDSSTTTQLSLMSMAKREAAKRTLYIRFYRGPVLAPDVPTSREPSSSSAPTQSSSAVSITHDTDNEQEKAIKKKRKDKKEKRPRSTERIDTVKADDTEKARKEKGKKRNRDGDVCVNDTVTPADEEALARKKNRKDKGGDSEIPSPVEDDPTKPPRPSKSESNYDSRNTSEKATRKAEKRKRKEERDARRAERDAKRQRKRVRKAEKEQRNE